MYDIARVFSNNSDTIICIYMHFPIFQRKFAKRVYVAVKKWNFYMT